MHSSANPSAPSRSRPSAGPRLLRRIRHLHTSGSCPSSRRCDSPLPIDLGDGSVRDCRRRVKLSPRPASRERRVGLCECRLARHTCSMTEPDLADFHLAEQWPPCARPHKTGSTGREIGPSTLSAWWQSPQATHASDLPANSWRWASTAARPSQLPKLRTFQNTEPDLLAQRLRASKNERTL